MNLEKIIAELEKEWDISGIFYQLRYDGSFDPEKFEKYITLIKSIEINGKQIDRKLVSLLWFLPVFMILQKERIIENGFDVKHLENAINEITTVLQEKLGVP